MEKNISQWAIDPICKNRGVTKGILYRAYQRGDLPGTRFKGSLSIRISRDAIENFLHSST
jgi:hypothetical protein